MTVRTMSVAVVAWAAELMAARRAVYEAYSPVFWRPHPDAPRNHPPFLRKQIEAEDAIALRTENGFLIARPVGDTLLIDDFAVDQDDAWPIDGRSLVVEAWARRPDTTAAMRIVTAAADTAKVSLLTGLALRSVEQWWVTPVGEAQTAAPARPHPVAAIDWSGIVAPAPPVYDPGGPVLLIRRAAPRADPDSMRNAARADGAVLVVLPIPTGDDRERELAALGWSVASTWYAGVPATP